MLAPPPLPRTLAACLRDLSSQKAQTRASAVRDLVRHALLSDETRTTSIPLFEKALRDDVSIVRSGAAVALADVHASEALPALLVAVEDEDAHVRQMALNALGEIGDRRARARLSRALVDSRPEVRYQAIIAFARVAKDEPADVALALESALGDKDHAIRYIALRLAEDHRLEAHTALAKRTRALLIDDQEDAKVTLAAAIFLARSGDDRARAALVAVVRDGAGGAEREDEQAAVELAGVLALREAIPYLERRAWGVTRLVRETCAWHSKIALASMRHERATREILDDLGSWRRDARQAAVVAAGRARLAEARAKIAALGDTVDADLAKEALALIDLGAREQPSQPSPPSKAGTE